MIDVRVDGESGRVKFDLCGTDISKLVRSATFELEDQGRPILRVQLDLATIKDARLEGDALVGLTDEMKELLQEFGWTPPSEQGS